MNAPSTASDSRRGQEERATPCAHLFVAICCGTPLDAPSRHSLAGIAEVRIGRGPARSAIRGDDADRGKLSLTLADPRASSAHARLFLRDGGWRVEDFASKNGLFVNGIKVDASDMADGDVLQIGQTLLIFRAAMLTQVGATLDVEATARVPVLSTLIPTLAHKLDVLAAVATSDVPMLLCSETGTGKELLAHAVHALSRRGGLFVPVNCGSLQAALAESMLFGHRRGAFTGAASDHQGLFHAANAGTLFLDEVGDMPCAVQASMLRALHDGEILPVGATHPVHVDARVVSATHRDLESFVADGRFREDLLARLSGFVFRLPPLRERREDIGAFTRVILGGIAQKNGSVPALTPEVGMLLLNDPWPRNARELEKCLTHAAVLAGQGPIEVAHLPQTVTSGREGRPTFSSEDRIHARLVDLLTASAGNVSAVADAMNTSRSQVHRWMKRFAVQAAAFRR
jgi:transcriptional regulator with PAS, ATPase and Fis domain